MHDLTLTPEQYNAHVVGDVIASTTPATEAPDAARSRAGAIVEMFKGFEPATALESMLACHCISLRYVLMGAVRAALAGGGDARLLLRQQAMIASLTRTAILAEAHFEKVRARGEARAAEADTVPARTAEPVARAGKTPDAPKEAVAEAPLPAVPLAAVPLAAVPLAAVPLPAVPLAAVPLAAAAPAPREVPAVAPAAPFPRAAPAGRDGAGMPLPSGTMPFTHADRAAPPYAAPPYTDPASLPCPGCTPRGALLASTALAAGTVSPDTLSAGATRGMMPGTKDHRPATSA